MHCLPGHVLGIENYAILGEGNYFQTLKLAINFAALKKLLCYLEELYPK